MSFDDDQQYSENRDQLLNRFRESLKKPFSERYFDEDDLIEIFDYAGDLNDDYLRMEALMCGARFFPDSDALLERRGIFYSQYSDESRKQFLENTDITGNFILEVLNAREKCPEGDRAAQCLDDFLERYDSLSDEEVIQFIDLASSLNQWEWIKSRMPLLRKKVQYINVLLYEAAIVAELQQDFACGAQLLEELTEIEPFNSYFWMLLSRMYAQNEASEKAMSAIDYALAINPDAPQSLLVKAKLMHSSNDNPDEILTIANRALELAPNDIDILRFLSMLYQNNEKPEKAVEILNTALETPSEAEEDNAEKQKIFDIVPELIMLDPDNIDTLLDRFYQANDENSHLMWASWAQQLTMQGRPEIARKIVKCYERNSGNKIPSLFAIEDAFSEMDFVNAVQEMEDYVNSIGSSEIYFPSIMSMHVLAVLKSLGPEKANELACYLKSNTSIDQCNSISSKLEYLGMIHIFDDITSKLNRRASQTTWDKYDPFGYWGKKET